MVIKLTPDIESALARAANRQGTTPELLALDCLRERFVPTAETEIAPPGNGTLLDFLAGHIGVLSSGEHVPGGARMSEDTGKRFVEARSHSSLVIRHLPEERMTNDQ